MLRPVLAFFLSSTDDVPQHPFWRLLAALGPSFSRRSRFGSFFFARGYGFRIPFSPIDFPDQLDFVEFSHLENL